MGNIEKSSEREKYIALLRDVALWLERHPDVPLPYAITGDTVTIYNCDTKEKLAAIASVLVRAKKKFDENYLILCGTSAMGFSVECTAHRGAVCERRVVGRKTVTKQIPTSFREETVEEDIIEWDCGSILAPEEQTEAK